MGEFGLTDLKLAHFLCAVYCKKLYCLSTFLYFPVEPEICRARPYAANTDDSVNLT